MNNHRTITPSKKNSLLVFGLILVAAGLKPLITGRVAQRMFHDQGTHVHFIVALGFGISGATMSATATTAAYQDGDWSGVISNGAATFLGGIALIPGIGTTVGYAQARVSAFLFLHQKSADAADYRNTLASARTGLATIGVAQRTIGNVAAEMAEKGCK